MANNNVPSFPYAAPNDAVLTVASDNAQTSLSGDIGASDASIAVADASAFAVPCLIVIDTEIIRANSKTGNTFTSCDRGFLATTAASHTQATDVFGYILAYHHNQLAAEVKSLGSYVIGADLSGFEKHQNLLTYSEAFDNAYWTASSGAAVQANTLATLPNGASSFNLVEGNSLGLNMISATPVGLVAGVTYTFSVYAKYTSSQWIAIGQNLAGTEPRSAWFDIQNGVVGTVGTDATASIIDLGGGWYRCLVTTACTADAYKAFDICLVRSDNTLGYLGTQTNAAIIAGAQVQSGDLSVPMSYIKTNGATFSMTGSGDLIRDEGDLSTGISIQRRRGTTTNHSSFTGALGELTIDTSKFVVVVHDGSTVGGYPLALESHVHADATTAAAGFMSAADKTKLDALPSGTISYQTVQANGAAQTQRLALNLAPSFTVTDDAAGNRTSVDLADSGVGAGTYTKVTVNAKGRVTSATLLGAADVPNLTASKITDFATAVSAVRLDQMAVPTADVSLNSNKLINVADPVSASDAATKQYVDTTATGLTFKAACRAASGGSNVNIAAPGTSIDTVSLNNGDRVLLKDQSDATQNGIYVFNGASSPMTRALDANDSAEVKAGMFVLVTEGATNADVGFVLSTTGAITLGTTNLTFVPFSSGGGTVTPGSGINVTGSTVSVKSADTSRIAVGVNGVDLATIADLTGGTYGQFTVDTYGRITAVNANQYQPLAANLTGLAALAANGLSARTGAGTFASRTIQPGTGITVLNGDGVAGNIQIGVTDNTTTQRVKVSKNGTLTAARQEINFIEGAGIILTEQDNTVNDRTDVTIAVAGGGGGAPMTAQYVTLATETNLTNERVLVASSPLVLTDGGAGNNITISFQTDLGSVP